MSLVGHKVRHRSWGEGIVESHAETFMSVRFMSTDEGEITKKFIFPDALVRGFLVGVDAESVAAIEKTIGDLKCSACGAQMFERLKLTGKDCAPAAKINMRCPARNAGRHITKM